MSQPFLSKPLTNVSLFSLSWALQILAARAAFDLDVGLGRFIVQSSVVGFLFAIAVLLPRVGGELARLWRCDRPIFYAILGTNALHYGVGSSLAAAGIASTQATNASFLMKLTLVSTALLERAFLAEPITLAKGAACTTMLAGAYLLATGGRGLRFQTGDVLLLLTCLCWSLGNVSIKYVMGRRPVSGEAIALLRPVAGLPVQLVFFTLVPVLLPAAGKALGESVWEVEGSSLSASFFVAVSGVAIALCWIFLNRTLRVASASYMTIMSMATPAIVAIVGFVWLGENLLPMQILGGVAIAAGSAIVHFGKVR